MSDIDAQLVKRVLDGDRSAYEALVARHIGRAQAIARGVLGNDVAVDDVVQEAFMRAYNRLGQLAQAQQFPSWLGTIARNEAITWLRKHKKIKHVDVEPLMLAAAAEDGGEADALEQERVRQSRCLRLAMRQIRDSYREVINLKYDVGLSYDDLADTLHTNVANVEKRLYRARKALQKEMEKISAQEDKK